MEKMVNKKISEEDYEQVMKGWKQSINLCKRMLNESKHQLVMSVLFMILMFLDGFLIGVLL